MVLLLFETQIVAASQSGQCFTAQILLPHQVLELNAVSAVSGHGFPPHIHHRPSKTVLRAVHFQGRAPEKVQFTAVSNMRRLLALRHTAARLYGRFIIEVLRNEQCAHFCGNEATTAP